MNKSGFSYLVKEGFRNIKMNKVISYAAIGVLIACMLLIGSSILLTKNINHIVGYFESQNEILVYLDQDNKIDHKDIAEEIKSLDNIKSIKFISKNDGLIEWMDNLGDDGTLLSWFIDDNPLQDSFSVILNNVDNMEDTVNLIKKIKGVESVSASFEVAKAITALKLSTSYISFAIIATLITVSILIIINTIKLSIFNKKKEISIMKYVGATDAFIKTPFLIQGILIGIISSTASIFILWGLYSYLISYISSSTFYYAQIILGSLIPFENIALQIYSIFLICGVILGGFGSALFVNKYLDV